MLRGIQSLLGFIVLGLSVTLFKDHNDPNGVSGFTAAPLILPLSAAIGAFTLVAAVFNTLIAWTEFLKEHIQMLVDVVIIMVNLIGGTVGDCETVQFDGS